MKKLDMRDLSFEEFEEASKPIVHKLLDLLEEHCESPREGLAVMITATAAVVLMSPSTKQRAELFDNCEQAFRACRQDNEAEAAKESDPSQPPADSKSPRHGQDQN